MIVSVSDAISASGNAHQTSSSRPLRLSSHAMGSRKKSWRVRETIMLKKLLPSA